MTNGTEKELRKMSRTELVEVIYQLQQEIAQTREESWRLEKDLDEARAAAEQVGTIADATRRLSETVAAAQALVASARKLSAPAETESAPPTENAPAETEEEVKAELHDLFREPDRRKTDNGGSA